MIAYYKIEYDLVRRKKNASRSMPETLIESEHCTSSIIVDGFNKCLFNVNL